MNTLFQFVIAQHRVYLHILTSMQTIRFFSYFLLEYHESHFNHVKK